MGREKTTDLEFEARKEKKKFKEKRKKDEPDRNSSLTQVSRDKMDEVVQVQKSDKNNETYGKSGEDKKKKKRKREMEGADNELKSNLVSEQELVNDSEKSNGKIVEEVEVADNEKRRKKLFADDQIGEAANWFKCSKDRDVAKIDQVEVDEKKKKKKKKKEKRDKVGGELVENIVTEGKEAGAESEQSDGQIMDRVEVDKKKKKKKVKEKREEMVGELVENIVTEGKEAGAESEQSDGKIMHRVEVDKKKKKMKMKEKSKEMGGELVENIVTEIMDKVEVDKKKKKMKKKSEEMGGELAENIITEGKEAGVESEQSDGQIMEKDGIMKKEKRKHRKNLRSQMVETVADKLSSKSIRIHEKEFLENDGNALATRDETSNRNIDDVNVEDGNKRKKKAKSDKGNLRKSKNDTAPDGSESTPRKALKRVTFSDDVEVFPPTDAPKDAEKSLVRGKRFSEEEDKLVKKAVFTYIEEHSLGDKGVDMVLHSKPHPEVRNCWKDIGAYLPWRPTKSVYHRAHVLLERGKERKWTWEEYNVVRRAAEEALAKGVKFNWRKLADEMGKHRHHVKDAWRRIKLLHMKKGHWSQQEYQVLHDCVNKDLKMRALEETRSKKHGMLRDNIKFEGISETMGTRTNSVCCQKWYGQLTSPLVAEGEWADVDDYRLVLALDSLDACCIEDVDWDSLLEHRSGDVCRKRWNQMVKHIGLHRTKPFAEQVAILSKRYVADAVEAREAFDSKPVVD